MSRRRVFFLVGLLAVVGLLTAGFLVNRETPNRPHARMTDHYLDPPGLADLEIGQVEPGVPVLCYHYFRAGFDPGYLLKVLGSVFFGLPALGPREFWTTPVGQFEKHLQYFADSGTVILSLDEVAQLQATDGPFPKRAVVLTIDDADRSVYTQAWPLLQKYGARAHLFVPTSKVGTSWSGLNVCTWSELAEMADSGTLLLGSHTHDMHYKIATDAGAEPVFWHPGEVDPARAWPDTLAQPVPAGPAVAMDLLYSRRLILEKTGQTADWLAWPYGFANGALDTLARDLGFHGTVSLKPATWAYNAQTPFVGRFTLTAKSTLERLTAAFPVDTP